jgi:hypothetical protein
MIKKEKKNKKEKEEKKKEKEEEEKTRGLHTNERHLLRPLWKTETRRT